MATTTTAQEEFNELMREKEVRRQHPEDDAFDGRSFLNLSDDSDVEDRTPTASPNHEDDNPRPSLSQARNTIPLTRYAANTGPKGVISDAQNFRDSRRMHRSSIQGSRRTSGLLSKQHLVKQSFFGPTFTEKSDGALDADDEDELEEEDDDFMRKWRMGRLKEMQSGAHDGAIRNRARKGRIWGGMATVDGNGFLDAVDNSPADTVVLVYIYDDYSEVSIAIEECLRDLAMQHVDVRCVKLHFEDAQMEPAGVPALLAYQRGDKFAGLVPMIDEIPDDAELSVHTLEVLLKRNQILR